MGNQERVNCRIDDIGGAPIIDLPSGPIFPPEESMHTTYERIRREQKKGKPPRKPRVITSLSFYNGTTRRFRKNLPPG